MALILNDQDVEKALVMKDCISVLEDAFRDLGLGTTVNAPRRDSILMCSKPDSYYSFKTMEGGLERLGVIAQRINSDLVTYPVINGVTRRIKVPAAPGNRYVGLIFLYSTETLELLAIMTDGHLQRMRVAATTGLGVKHLAREDARILALLGSGWQAESAAWAIACVRSLSEIRVFSPNEDHRRSFAKTLSDKLGIRVVPTSDTITAVKGADIVACASNSSGPIVRGDWIEPGMHCTSIIPTELDESCWQKSNLIITSSPMGAGGFSVDFSEHSKSSKIETMQRQLEKEEHLFKSYQKKIFMLSDLLIGKTPHRTEQSQITLMNKNWGLGIEFAAVGKLVYDNARSSGIGKEIPTEWFSQTSHP